MKKYNHHRINHLKADQKIKNIHFFINSFLQRKFKNKKKKNETVFR